MTHVSVVWQTHNTNLFLLYTDFNLNHDLPKPNQVLLLKLNETATETWKLVFFKKTNKKQYIHQV